MIGNKDQKHAGDGENGQNPNPAMLADGGQGWLERRHRKVGRVVVGGLQRHLAVLLVILS